MRHARKCKNSKNKRKLSSNSWPHILSEAIYVKYKQISKKNHNRCDCLYAKPRAIDVRVRCIISRVK